VYTAGGASGRGMPYKWTYLLPYILWCSVGLLIFLTTSIEFDDDVIVHLQATTEDVIVRIFIKLYETDIFFYSAVIFRVFKNLLLL